jgi:hypothetical protein
VSTGRDDLERLRRFLLGDIAEAEREAIERQCLAEHSLIFDQLVALEDELRFDYLQGRLSPADHTRFERRYASTPEGKSKLAFAQAVLLSSDAAPASPSPRTQAKTWGSLVVLAGLGAAVVALAVVAGLQFSAARQLREDLAQAQAGSSKDSEALVKLQAEVTRTQSALTKAQSAATAASEELAKEQARRQDVELQLASFRRPLTTPVATPTPTPAATVAAALTLKPGLLSTSQDIAKIDNQTVAKGLQLSLTLPGGSGNYPMYAAALLSADGKPIWTQAHLTRTGKIVSFMIPAGRLKRSDYQVLLRGIMNDGRPEDLAGYAFKVLDAGAKR